MAPVGRFRKLWKRCPLLCCMNRDREDVAVAPPSSPEPQAAGLCKESPSGTYTVEKLPSSLGSVGVKDTSGLANLREEEWVTKLSGEVDIRPPWEEVEIQTSNWERRQNTPSLIYCEEDSPSLIIQSGEEKASCSRTDLDLQSRMDSLITPDNTFALYKDLEDHTIDEVSNLEDEEWDPLSSLASSLDSEEEEEAALHPSRWPSFDPEKSKELLHHLCQLLSSPSSGEATQAVDCVARKHLRLATEHFLESPGRQCGELMCAVLNSPYCSLEAALDLLLAKVKEGPWLPQEGEEQLSPTWDAAVAKATRAIGGIVACIHDIQRLELWLPDLLLALVNLFIEITSLEEEGTKGNQEKNSLPSCAILKILRNLLNRMAQVSLEKTSMKYRALFHHEAPKIRKSALTCYWYLLQHLEHPHQEDQTILDLLAVLMLVEDEDAEVAEAAKVTLWEVAEVLQWQLKGSLLAGDTFTQQEVLYKVAKCLIQRCGSREEVADTVRGCLVFLNSQHPWVRRTAAMLIGHLVHKACRILTKSNICTYEAWLESLLSDQEPDVRRVAGETKAILSKAFDFHCRHGLRAAFQCVVLSCRRKRYPSQYLQDHPT